MIALQDLAQFAEVLDDHVRFAGPQLIHAIISRQHGAGTDASEFGGFNIVLHVANKNGLGGGQLVFGQQLCDLGPFVPNIQVGPVNKFIETVGRRLPREIIPGNRAEQKCPNFVLAAKDQEFAGMGQFRDLILHLAEVTVKGLFQPLHGNPWRKAVVKVFEGQAKLGAEFIKGHLSRPRTPQRRNWLPPKRPANHPPMFQTNRR